MKITIFMMLILSSLAFASEKEGEDYCSAYRARKVKIQRELDRMNAEFFSKEEEGSWSTPAAGSFNCEDVPDTRTTYLQRYDSLSREQKENERNIERYCPRSYPE